MYMKNYRENKTNRTFGKVYFTSDTHFGHGNIIKYCNRPFLSEIDKQALLDNGGSWHDGSWKGSRSSSWKMSREAIDMMDNELIENINETVGENDVLWHLGDFAFGSKENYAYKCQLYRNRIRCKNVNIIWGNHDEPYLIRNLFNESHYLYDLRLSNSKTKAILCHYALSIWEGSHRKNIHLYGHSHSEAEIHLEKKFPGRRSMDVGVDNIAKIFGKYRPISLEQVQNILSTREGCNLGDHHIDPNAPSEQSLQ